MRTEIENVREFWNRVADDWQLQVGTDGDANRRLNSDPVLWAFAGDVRGLKVLDAGCGTGYLSIKLAACGAAVTGIDFSERMIAIAGAADPTGDFRVDSVSELSTLKDDEFDMVVANYVLMDTPDLERRHQGFPSRAQAGRCRGARVFTSVFSSRTRHTADEWRRRHVCVGLSLFSATEMRRSTVGALYD